MKKKRVLIVDDEEEIRELLVMLLKPLGVETVTATDGLQAGGLIAERPYDLVITDYRIPGIDGAGLTRRIKQALPACHVIAVTGSGDLEALRAAGADFCLPKPFDVARLTSLLSTLLSPRRAAAPPAPG